MQDMLSRKGVLREIHLKSLSALPFLPLTPQGQAREIESLGKVAKQVIIETFETSGISARG